MKLIFENIAIAELQARVIEGLHIKQTAKKSKDVTPVKSEPISDDQFNDLVEALKEKELIEYYESRYSVQRDGIYIHLLERLIKYDSVLSEADVSILSKECGLSANDFLYTIKY